MGTHPPILLGNLGMTDSLILMVMALVVFGPRRLPQIGRQIGKLMYEFRKASNDFKFQMEEELRNAEEADRRKKEEERQRLLAAQTASEQASVSAPPPASSSPSAGETATTVTVTTDESVPRILPPSTGETVAAGKPSRGSGSAETSSEADGLTNPGSSPTTTGDSASSPPSETAEALNQHG